MIKPTVPSQLQTHIHIMAKKANPWTSETISESEQAGSVIWRAQISTAPDGKQFAGVRKYIVKRDGTELATKAGISLLVDEDTDKMVNEFGSLVLLVGKLQTYYAGTKKPKARKPTPSPCSTPL